MLPTILVILLITVVGISVLAYRNRSEKGIESGITSFRRELRALAPESKERPPSTRPEGDPPRSSGVGILRPGPDGAPGPGSGPGGSAPPEPPADAPVGDGSEGEADRADGPAGDGEEAD